MEPKWVETADGQIEVEDPDDYLIYLEDILKRIHELVPFSYPIILRKPCHAHFVLLSLRMYISTYNQIYVDIKNTFNEISTYMPIGSYLCGISVS